MNVEQAVTIAMKVLSEWSAENAANNSVLDMFKKAVIYGAQCQKEQSAWVSVNKQYPEFEPGNEEDVLVFGSKRGDLVTAANYMFAWWCPKTKKWLDRKNKDIEANPDMWGITHWQYLTTPPQSI